MKSVATLPTASAIESVMIQGDLSKLDAQQRVSYYNNLCQSLGLNPLTKPFEYIKFQGKEVLYARRDCTDQLRSLRKVSIKIVSRETIGTIYIVTAQATMPDGRCDEATGTLNIKGQSDDALAISMMKCETKAKRRVTLSICGLGLLDETEIEPVSREAAPAKADQVNALLNAPSQEIPEEPDFITEAAAAPPEPEQPAFEDYRVPIGKQFKGKRLGDISRTSLASYCTWVEDNIVVKEKPTLEFLANARAYLEETE